MSDSNEYVSTRRSDDRRDRDDDRYYRRKYDDHRDRYRDYSEDDDRSDYSRDYDDRSDDDYSSYSSSDQERYRGRDRSRDRDRRDERGGRHGHERSRRSSSSRQARSPSPSHRKRRDRHEKPTTTIIVHGLPTSIAEKEFRNSLEDARLNFSSFRIMRDRKSGSSKGFAFIDFYTLDDAKTCMADTRGYLDVRGYNCQLNYATPREDGDEDNFAHSQWRSEEPQNTIMLRGLALHTTEIEIRNLLDGHCAKYVDVRVIVNRRTGQSKGFGFIEFDSIASSQEWMERQQGVLQMGGQEVRLLYSTPKPISGSGDSVSDRSNSFATVTLSDWICSKCSTHNFKRRERCFRCNMLRAQSEHSLLGSAEDGADLVGFTPCNTLLLRNLDALTTEDNIRTAFTQLTAVPVRQCLVLRDDMTRLSRCYALVEFSSVTEAEHILEVNLKDKTTMFDIDGKAVTVSYARHTYKTMLSMENHKKALKGHMTEDDLQSSGGVTGGFISLSAGPMVMTGGADISNSANAAAALAQAALQKKHVNQQVAAVLAQQMKQASKNDSVQASLVSAASVSIASKPFDYSTWETTTYPVPDPSKFTFEPSCGFYYDTYTSLYYDSISKYFYDSRTQQYLYWDIASHRYIPASQLQQQSQVDSPAVITAAPQRNADVLSVDDDKKPEKKEKAKSAKQIAKEMERWAKAMNKGSETKKDQQTPIVTSTSSTSSNIGRAADTGYAMLEAMQNQGNLRSLVATQYDSGDEDQPTEKPVPATIPTVSANPDEILAAEEQKLIDASRMACLLCSRAFKDIDTLQKHRSHSDLHKKNLDSLRERLGLPNKSSMDEAISIAQGMLAVKGRGVVEPPIQYRDRAKERRDKYGIPSPPRSKKVRTAAAPSKVEEEEYVEPVAVPFVPTPAPALVSDNVGARLMQKMGWQLGQGLGRENQGRTSIIEAELRHVGAGLGSSAAKARAPPSGHENYKDKVKQAMFARFQELE